MRLKSIGSSAVAVMLAFTAVSCGKYVREQGRAPAQAVILSLQGAPGNSPSTFGNPLASDVETLLTTPSPCSASSPCKAYLSDLGQVVMQLILKDPGQTGLSSAPSALNQVTFTRYRVEYRRSDGRNTPGVDVPFPIDSVVTFTVPAETSASASFELVRIAAKEEPPLRELRTSPVTLSTIADVTFYGRDQAGNDVTASGSIAITFGNFAP